MERIGALLPIGSGDEDIHRGARRRSRRFPLNAEVEVISPITAKGVTLNASAGGLRIVLDRELPPGELCQLEVHFTDDRCSHERARVVWSRKLPDGWVYGLEFTNIDWYIPSSDSGLFRAA